MKTGMPSKGSPISFFHRFSNSFHLRPGRFFFDFLKIPLDILESACYTIIVPREWARQYESSAEPVGWGEIGGFWNEGWKSPLRYRGWRPRIINAHRCRHARSRKSREAAKIFSISCRPSKVLLLALGLPFTSKTFIITS